MSPNQTFGGLVSSQNIALALTGDNYSVSCFICCLVKLTALQSVIVSGYFTAGYSPQRYGRERTEHRCSAADCPERVSPSGVLVSGVKDRILRQVNGLQGQALIRRSFLNPLTKVDPLLRGPDGVPVQRGSSEHVSCGAEQILMLIPLQCAAPFVPSHTLLAV